MTGDVYFGCLAFMCFLSAPYTTTSVNPTLHVRIVYGTVDKLADGIESLTNVGITEAYHPQPSLLQICGALFIVRNCVRGNVLAAVEL